MPFCEFCNQYIETEQGVRSHVKQKEPCRLAYERSISAAAEQHVAQSIPPHVDHSSFTSGIDRAWTPPPLAAQDDSQAGIPRSPRSLDGDNSGRAEKRRRVTVEEVPDIEQGGLPSRPWVEDFPREAGTPLRDGQTHFEEIRARKASQSESPWAPFESEEEWELAEWLMKSGISQKALDKYLKLPITQRRTSPSFRSSYLFYKKIDDLPGGFAKWKVEFFEAVGDERDEDGNLRIERVELWRRDPVECVRELLGNPLFRQHMRFAPERLYADGEGKQRMYSNMHTAEWWWDLQMLLPEGATIAPVILSSDKTTLSRMSGDKTAWPCMRAILEPLIAAGREGVEMVCADGRVRRVYPILAAYIADHPEQCLVAGCQENYCPKCSVEPNKRGEPVYSCLKDQPSVASILAKHSAGETSPEFDELGLRAIEPFWDGLPHCDIFAAITPDILHQLHKGLFKDHLVSWATKSIQTDGAGEVDRRFKAMPRHPGLRHFKNGISIVAQWTGTEFKNMERVFLGTVAGAAPDVRVIRAVRAVLDFIYYAHFETHTDDSLHALHAAWREYHENKAIFVTLGIRKDFNFPKGHSTEHYERSIRQKGTADGYSTEHSERLHIDFAKLAYGASNKQSSYLKQMTRWLDRQEAVHRFSAYLDWAMPERATSTVEREDSLSDDEEDPQAEEDRVEPARLNATEDPFIRGYSIAKVPAYPSLTVAQLIHEFGATDFIRCLSDYLHKVSIGNARRLNHTSIPINDLSRLSAYKQFKVRLPVIKQVSSDILIDTIQAAPAKPSRGLIPSAPPKMSVVLVRDSTRPVPGSSENADATPPNPLEGLRVARVRAIFTLPSSYDAAIFDIHDPLAYVEWFTPFQVVDPATGMYIVSHSTRQHRRFASIIPITDIIRTCHLIPVWGKRIDPSWTSDTVLDRCTKFFVNPYLRHHDFVLFRYLSQK
ncbi:hypothetical protein C8Q76DRAFT_634235 [Earliella scabrosa]|nr:hypothetical protein C8Q76DRAFT_634235 [Earliella scabrosa]